MGLGMQIVYLGFPGSSALEAEAGVQLLRLERFSGGVLAGCHLAIERMHPLQPGIHQPAYDVRLDLVSASRELAPLGHCEGDDPVAAMRAAFDAAERQLGSTGPASAFCRSGARRRDH
ncbi:hypothetical protein M3I54_24280 [Paraburkholderia sp. CNPSo 3274]|uniref:hypothetical protein n=1 Tax=Paraburkholderia sp. CNPSo 3274 TaxID=2940932 RepID=UPI0020B6E36E|nr:hypothetical protein [Paraburkholderia sp. CNPSo 3274]MCP3710057.1 hypothetical protein [Paraburkholderia sp. CNPSo 3274]